MKLLRNRKTKALFPYSEALLKLNNNMEVYDTTFDEPAIEDMGIIEPNAPVVDEDAPQDTPQDAPNAPVAIMIGDKPIEDAEKKDLVEYLSIAFNETMPARSTKQELIDKIIELSA